MDTKKLTRAGIIAALYVVITFALKPVSFGQIQFRASEALTVLPILYPEAIPALFVGVLIANIFGGMGLYDIIGGSITTLIAAFVTYKYRNSIIAYLSPIVFNAFLISLYLRYFTGWPYWMLVLSIGISEGVVVFLLGYPLVSWLKRKEKED